MKMRKLKYCPYGRTYATVDEHGAISLVSYSTTVIVIDPMGWLTCTGTYSRTTIRHISAFMKEYTNLTYQDAKNAFRGNHAINIYTGEIQPLGEG